MICKIGDHSSFFALVAILENIEFFEFFLISKSNLPPEDDVIQKNGREDMF